MLRFGLLLLLLLAWSGCESEPIGRGDAGIRDTGISDVSVTDTGADGGLSDRDDDGFRSDVDCDDDDPMVGSVASRSCTGECEGFMVQCANGVWEECPTDEDCDCEPGTERELLCPMCATQIQTCEADGRWGAPGACVGAGECLAISTETLGSCGRCGGVSQRFCTAECRWEAPTCDESTASCNAWVLRPGATTWEGWAVPTAGGPSNVQAAWAIEGTNRVWVLGDRVHEFDPACLSGPSEPADCWITSGTRAAYFDAMVQDELIYYGHSVPTTAFGTTEQQITLIGATFDHQFLRHPTTGAIRRMGMGPASEFSDPEAPAVRSQVRAGFPRVSARDGWVSVACGSPAAVPDGYLVYLAPQVSFFTLPFPECGFFEQVPFASFAPFTRTAAPALSQIGAAAYDDSFGLLIFGETL